VPEEALAISHELVFTRGLFSRRLREQPLQLYCLFAVYSEAGLGGGGGNKQKLANFAHSLTLKLFYTNV
jgi:hypothetical protein